MMNQASFWDKAAAKYAKNPIKDMASYEHTLDRTRSYLKKTDTIRELGCGTGSTALLLAADVAQVVATDVSANMIAIATEKAKQQGIPNVRFLQADLTDPTISAEPVDAVLAFNLLHLIPEPANAILPLTAGLPQGGLFISKTPCLASKAWLFAPMIKVMQWLGKAPFVGMISVDEMDKMVVDAGFEILETSNYPASPPSRYIVARKV